MSGVINIREPIWKGMMVGVDSYKFNDLLYVQILYKNVHGSKMFPFILKMRGNIASHTHIPQPQMCELRKRSTDITGDGIPH